MAESSSCNYPIISLETLEKEGKIHFLKGQGVSKKDFDDTGKNYCIHYGDLYTQYLTPTITKVVHKTNVTGKILSKHGDVLVPGTTTADAMGIAIARALDEDGVILGGDINIIRTNNSYLLAKFLAYVLSYTMKTELASHAKGTNILHLYNKDIKKIKIPVPTLDKQKEFVKLFEEVSKKIDCMKANAEFTLSATKDLFDGYLDNLTAPKDKLGKYINITTGKLNSNAACPSGEYPFFTCSRTPLKINSFAFDTEAILLAGNNASGDFNVKHYKGKFNAYQRTYVITIPDVSKLDYRYLYFQLLKALSELKKMSLGANTKFLRVGMITDFQLAMPSMVEQKAIVSKLDRLQEKTQELSNLYEKKIKLLDDLKQSILKQAFAGEL